MNFVIAGIVLAILIMAYNYYMYGDVFQVSNVNVETYVVASLAMAVGASLAVVNVTDVHYLFMAYQELPEKKSEADEKPADKK